MEIYFSALMVFITIYAANKVLAHMELLNVTIERKNSWREKRFLVYERFGLREFVCGFAVPVEFYDKKPWRSIAAVYLFHAQYLLPTTPIYWWDKWDARSMVEARKQYDKDGTHVPDESRVYIYSLIESFLTKTGRNGRKCLLRAICENAIVNVADGVLNKIILKVLTPGDDTPEEYRDAYKAGRYGAVCISMYPECPMGQGLLDGISYVEKTPVRREL